MIDAGIQREREGQGHHQAGPHVRAYVEGVALEVRDRGRPAHREREPGRLAEGLGH